jgi:hypothetical protein
MEALMRAAPVRFLNAALWPLTIWGSLTHLDEHPADDYVERTSPIVATAIAFWVCFVGLVILATPVALTVGGVIADGELIAAQVRRVPEVIVRVFSFFVPVIYIAGFWLFTARDEAFPR